MAYPDSTPSATFIDHGDARELILAVTTELGLTPSGASYATVAARLTAIEADIAKSDANAFYTGSAWPTRASITTHASRRVRWIGPEATKPPINATYAKNGDVLETTS